MLKPPWKGEAAAALPRRRRVEAGNAALINPPMKLKPERNREALRVQLDVIDYLYWAAQQEDNLHIRDDVYIAMRTVVNAMNGWTLPDVAATFEYLGLYPSQVFAAIEHNRQARLERLCGSVMEDHALMHMLGEKLDERKIHLVHVALRRMETTETSPQEKRRLELVKPIREQEQVAEARRAL